MSFDPKLSLESRIDKPGSPSEVSSPPLIYKESSVIRKLRDFFSKIFCDFWRSLRSLNGRVHRDVTMIPANKKVIECLNLLNSDIVQTETESSYEQIDCVASKNSKLNDVPAQNQPPLCNTNVLAAVKSLNTTEVVGDATLLSYSEYLNAQYKNIQAVGEFLLPGKERDSEFMLPGVGSANRILIPIVFKGFGRDHIVCIGVDRSEGRLEFFDSKGLTVADRKSEIIKGLPKGVNLPQFLEKIRKAYFEEGQEVTVYENTVKAQEDCHNCGIYVCNYMRRFAQQRKNIFESPLSYAEANGEERRAIISELMNHFMENYLKQSLLSKSA